MKYSINQFLFAAAFAAVFYLAGCSDDSTHKASKQARRATSQALETLDTTGDIEKAQNQLTGTLSTARRAGPAGDTALFVNASLLLNQAEKASGTSGRLSAQRQEVLNVINQLDRVAAELVTLQARRHQLQVARSSREEQIAKLKEALADARSLKSDLDAQLQQYLQSKTELESRLQKVRARAEQQQQTADQLLRKAELAEGDEKLKLQRSAYDLLLGKTADTPPRSEFVFQIQQTLDKIEVIDSEISGLQTRLDSLEKRIPSLAEYISNLETSAGQANFSAQLQDLDSEINRQQQHFAELLAGASDAAEEYEQSLAEVLDRLDRAAGDYKHAASSRAPAISQPAGLALGDCYTKVGTICAGAARFYQSLESRIQNLTGLAGPAVTDKLNLFIDTCSKKSEDLVSRAMENLDAALEQYQETGRRLRRGADQFSCAVIKNQILVIAEKARLAADLKDNQTADQLLAEAEQMLKQVVECDAAFADSPLAELLRQLKPDIVIPAAPEPTAETPPPAPAEPEPPTGFRPRPRDPNALR